MKQIDMVVDMQFGSTGKGLLAGYLAIERGHDTILTAWGPNAGHTFIDEDGRKYVHTMLANGIVGPRVRRVLIGPGSVLNLDNLWAEILDCIDIFDDQLISVYIHPHATVVTEADREAEKDKMTAIGSTKKGVGAALSRKIARDPASLVCAKDFRTHALFAMDCVRLVASPAEWTAVLDQGTRYLVEGAQGFGLSMHHGFYPYTTSRDVTPMQILADCGIPWHIGKHAKVWGTARTYPIRVANRYDEQGDQIGWSGPHYEDQLEIRWAEIGLQPELTTVTRLPRRLFTYSHQQMCLANDMCGPDAIFLNFINYLRSPDEFVLIHESIEQLGIKDLYYGIGPRVDDIIHSRNAGVTKDWEMLQNAIAARS